MALVETLGRDILLHADIAGGSLRALVTPAEASRLSTGAPVTLGVKLHSWHFFDAETGDRVEPFAALGSDRHGGPVAAVR